MRSARIVYLYKKSDSAGALGGDREGFSGTPRRFRASVSYMENQLGSSVNGLVAAPYGYRAAQGLRIRFIGDIDVEAGDGVKIDYESGRMWRCVQVDKHPYVTVVRVEKAL